MSIYNSQVLGNWNTDPYLFPFWVINPHTGFYSIESLLLKLVSTTTYSKVYLPNVPPETTTHGASYMGVDHARHILHVQPRHTTMRSACTYVSRVRVDTEQGVRCAHVRQVHVEGVCKACGMRVGVEGMLARVVEGVCGPGEASNQKPSAKQVN
jgi:hypothetical protein